MNPPEPTPNPDKPVTFPEVAMRVAQDGPMYALIVAIAVLALLGHASPTEALIGGLASLLARSWPRPPTMLGGTIIPLVIAVGLVGKAVACTPPEAAYVIPIELELVHASTGGHHHGGE